MNDTVNTKLCIRGNDGNVYCWDYIRKTWFIVEDVAFNEVPRDVLSKAMDMAIAPEDKP